MAGVTSEAILLVGYAAALGVGIDLDHFLLARLNDGDWRAARRCLADPRMVFLEQDQIFRTDEVGTLLRLLSHVVITGVLVGVLVLLTPELAVFTAVILYLHVLADIYADNRIEGTLPWQESATQRRKSKRL